MTRTIKTGLLFTCLLGIAFLSCKKKEYSPLYMGYDYFPNKVGHYVIYNCDSVVKTAKFGTVHYKYQIKELIQSLFTNNQGQTTQRIVRYKRDMNDTANTPWSTLTIPEKVWSGNLLSNMAIRQEDNYPLAKLVFPPAASEMWNGNVVNTLAAYNYQYTTLNSPYTLNDGIRSIHFDSVATVLEQKDSNNQVYHYNFEQYATGIGMIHRVVFLDSSSVFNTLPPDTSQNTVSGIWYTETCLTSGYQ